MVWSFQKHNILGFLLSVVSRNRTVWCERQKSSNERQTCLVNLQQWWAQKQHSTQKCITDVRGQRKMAILYQSARKDVVTRVNNYTLQSRWAEKHLGTQNRADNSRRLHGILFLSAKHRKRRIQRAQSVRNWTVEDWTVFEKSEFLLWPADGRVRIWRKQHGQNLLYVYSSSCCWWWWKGVGNVCMAPPLGSAAIMDQTLSFLYPRRSRSWRTKSILKAGVYPTSPIN